MLEQPLGGGVLLQQVLDQVRARGAGGPLHGLLENLLTPGRKVLDSVLQ